MTLGFLLGLIAYLIVTWVVFKYWVKFNDNRLPIAVSWIIWTIYYLVRIAMVIDWSFLNIKVL